MVNNVVRVASGNRGEVGHAVGVKREEFFNAVGGRDTDGRLSDQLGRVPAHFLAAVDQVADQLQTRRPKDLPKRDRSGVTGADMCYPILVPHTDSRWRLLSSRIVSRG